MTPEHKEQVAYLFYLQRSGAINMLEAGAFLVSEFGITKQEAKRVLLDWMKNWKTYAEEFKQ